MKFFKNLFGKKTHAADGHYSPPSEGTPFPITGTDVIPEPGISNAHPGLVNSSPDFRDQELIFGEPTGIFEGSENFELKKKPVLHGKLFEIVFPIVNSYIKEDTHLHTEKICQEWVSNLEATIWFLGGRDASN